MSFRTWALDDVPSNRRSQASLARALAGKTNGRPLLGGRPFLVRGPNVFREYWRNPDATAETLVDGWLRTGDIGELDDEGFLKISGRKKDIIIITAGGKNLTPANLENDLKQSRFISQAMMHGDRRPFPVALITLDEEEIRAWARERGKKDDLVALARDDDAQALVRAELDRANAKYAQVEQIKKFTILDHDLSAESGELTPHTQGETSGDERALRRRA